MLTCDTLLFYVATACALFASLYIHCSATVKVDLRYSRNVSAQCILLLKVLFYLLLFYYIKLCLSLKIEALPSRPRKLREPLCNKLN